jgi:hypothetical protein
VVGSNGWIVYGAQFERSGGMSGRSDDVPDLSTFRQGVEEGGTGRGDGSARSVACRGLSCIAGLLSGPVCRPRAITYYLGPLGSIRECLCSVDRGSWPTILGAFTFEDRQRGPCASRCVAGDLPEFGRAEFDRRGIIRHGIILQRRGL